MIDAGENSYARAYPTPQAVPTAKADSSAQSGHTAQAGPITKVDPTAPGTKIDATLQMEISAQLKVDTTSAYDNSTDNKEWIKAMRSMRSKSGKDTKEKTGLVGVS